jgi:hypothetical protein
MAGASQHSAINAAHVAGCPHLPRFPWVRKTVARRCYAGARARISYPQGIPLTPPLAVPRDGFEAGYMVGVESFHVFSLHFLLVGGCR